MNKDDDILASLPRPPHPAPARREAAIAEALRRFDGGAPTLAAEPRREPGPAPWRTWFNRPNSGALAGALLVALIALPLAWTSLPDQARDGGRDVPAATVERERASGPAMADASPSGPASEVPPQPSPGDPETKTAAAADSVAEPSAVEPSSDPRPVPSAEPDSKASGPNEQAFAEAETSGEIVVTGARIARPNLTSPSPVTVVGEERVTAAARRSAARRGDWNACTIDDPGRDLGGCRASSRIAPGLARAWAGDWDGAVQAFDAVIAAAPRSSAAYLNRGMIHRRRSELQPALADLDRAVRYAPRAARNYYHRSLVLRQLGDVRRARADEARAVELDPRYAVVVPADR